jgi:hypothetical protein
MWQRYIFGVYWRHLGKLYYDEFSAESEKHAAEYFNYLKRDDVMLENVQRVRPDDNGVRELAHSSQPLLPFGPLMARRRTDRDEDAR